MALASLTLSFLCDKSHRLMETLYVPGDTSQSFIVATDNVESIISTTDLLSFHRLAHMRPTCKNHQEYCQSFFPYS